MFSRFDTPKPYLAPNPDFPHIIPDLDNANSAQKALFQPRDKTEASRKAKRTAKSPEIDFDFELPEDATMGKHERKALEEEARRARFADFKATLTSDQSSTEGREDAQTNSPETSEPPQESAQINSEQAPEDISENLPDANPVETADCSLYDRAVAFLGPDRCARIGYEKNPPSDCLRPTAANFFTQILRDEYSRLSNDIAIAVVAFDPDTSHRPILCYDYDHLLKFPIPLSRDPDDRSYRISPVAPKVYDVNRNRLLLQDNNFLVLVRNENRCVSIHICQK